MLVDYQKRLYEVNEILNYLPQEDYNKIPVDIIQFIQNNMEKDYYWSINKEKAFENQELNRDTIAILSYINTEYLLNQEQKDFMEQIHIQNDINMQNEIKDKYNVDELFKKKIKQTVNINENLEIITKDDNLKFWKKIIRKIKNVLKFTK